MRTAIGIAIRRHRSELGLSQNALAKRAGVSQGYVSLLEAGSRSHVSVGIVRRLADALQVSIHHLLEKEHQPMPRVGRTEMWLYQMRERDDWTYDDYCREVREGRLLYRSWDESTSMIYRLGGRLPLPGDLIVLFFVPTGGRRPGLCGIGVITEFTRERQLRFRALPPTETVQQSPRWSSKAQRLLEAIRAGTVAEGTMWRVTRREHIKGLWAELYDELSGRWASDWARRGSSAVPSRPIEGAGAPR
ncbi:MAG TPA: helix-turn-helix transcriptional regulator [Methylomirabilota bacterium]|jgi:transcriptional regulator with XRE-family HTH domain|nr:helix-turn-helix transcriptional regulator [Methylomirabilota bacterium]